jgi:hypothetical protein
MVFLQDVIANKIRANVDVDQVVELFCKHAVTTQDRVLTLKACPENLASPLPFYCIIFAPTYLFALLDTIPKSEWANVLNVKTDGHTALQEAASWRNFSPANIILGKLESDEDEDTRNAILKARSHDGTTLQEMMTPKES